MFNFEGYQQVPGVSTNIEQVISQYGLTFSELSQLRWLPVQFDGASRDAGNTGFTDVLRPNLLVGQVTATKKFKQWDPTATDGSQNIAGILVHELKMQALGSNVDRFTGAVLFAGGIYSKALQIASLTTRSIVGSAEEYNIRSQMVGPFQFDDDPMGRLGGIRRGVTILAATTTLTAAHVGTLIVVRGAGAAVNLTLPTTPSKSMRFDIVNCSDQNLTLTAGTPDTMVVLNDLNADSVALSTASEKVGGAFEVVGDGTGWIVMPKLWETQTPTIVT